MTTNNHGYFDLWDFDSLADAIKAVPEYGIIRLPANRRVVLDEPLPPIRKHLTIQGGGTFCDGKPTFSSGQWTGLDQLRGSVIEARFDSGAIFDQRDLKMLNLRDVMLYCSVPQNNVTGVVAGEGAYDPQNTATWNFANHLYWQNVICGNLRTGIKLVQASYCTFEHTQLYGCDVGLQLGSSNLGDGQGINTSQFININASGCNIALESWNAGTLGIHGLTLQGVQEVGFRAHGLVDSIIELPYGENNQGLWFDFVGDAPGGVTGNRIVTPWQANAQHDKIRLGSGASGNTIQGGTAMGTIEIAGYRNYVERLGDVLSKVVDTGVWNYFREIKDAGISGASHFLMRYASHTSDPNPLKFPGLALHDIDLIVPDKTSGERYRLTVDNGVLGVEPLDGANS